jgi:hypothetical protein
MLAVEFARFCGLEFSARANMPDIVNAVCATAANTAAETGTGGRNPQPEPGHPGWC